MHVLIYLLLLKMHEEADYLIPLVPVEKPAKEDSDHQVHYNVTSQVLTLEHWLELDIVFMTWLPLEPECDSGKDR